MKKLPVLILTMMLCAFLAACSGKEAAPQNENAATEEQPAAVENESEAMPEMPTESVEEVTEESIEPAEKAFDTAWAGDDYAMPIPEPPFAHEIEIRDNGAKISSTNGGENGDVTHDNILAYCSTLKEIGFSTDVRENVIGERYGRTCYDFGGNHENGNSVELLDDGGSVIIYAYFDINAEK